MGEGSDGTGHLVVESSHRPTLPDSRLLQSSRNHAETSRRRVGPGGTLVGGLRRSYPFDISEPWTSPSDSGSDPLPQTARSGTSRPVIVPRHKRGMCRFRVVLSPSSSPPRLPPTSVQDRDRDRVRGEGGVHDSCLVKRHWSVLFQRLPDNPLVPEGPQKQEILESGYYHFDCLFVSTPTPVSPETPGPGLPPPTDDSGGRGRWSRKWVKDCPHTR